MFNKAVLPRLCILQHLHGRPKSNSAVNLEKLDQESAVDLEIVDDESKLRDQEIELKRNKSRLAPQHYNMLHNKMPYSQPAFWTHGTIKYKRRMYGLYGEASGVSAAICWPTKQELADKIEYERVAYPFTIPQMIEMARTKQTEKEQRKQARQKEIVEKMKKLEGWKQDLFNKIGKKEADILAAKERKERLVEEVRRHFGYTIDPRDEKFKEMLEKKEKEQKKAMKEAKRKVKEDKMISKMLTKKSDDTETNEEIAEK